MFDRFSAYAPYGLAILRIVTGLLFVHAGLAVLFNFPPPPPGSPPEMATLMAVAGWLELVGGLLILVGWLTRPVAFVLCGMMAVAYWMVHAPMGFWPVANFGPMLAALRGGTFRVLVSRAHVGSLPFHALTGGRRD